MTRDDITNIEMTTGEWGQVRAYATIQMANGLIIKGAKVIQGKKGLFVGMPAVRKQKEGKDSWEDCIAFASEEDRKTFDETVVQVYNKRTSGAKQAKSLSGAGGSTTHGSFDETSFI
jgi:DNA-binding cell septation regulator SpoVG